MTAWTGPGVDGMSVRDAGGGPAQAVDRGHPGPLRSGAGWGTSARVVVPRRMPDRCPGNGGRPVQILLTNDDGVFAPGLRALRKELLRLGDVTVIGPALEQ